MEVQKQYRDDLLEWCNNLYSFWSSMKPKVSELLDVECVEEWEGSCRQLKEKLQTDLNVDYDDYLTAKSLYEQWERLFVEPNTYQEELKADSDHRLEWEKQTQFHEGLLERYAYQEELEVESDHRLEGEEQTQFHVELLDRDAYHEELEVKTEEQLRYRDELLEWCNSIYSNWESMKPTFSKLFDLKSLEEWEGSYRYLKEKLQADEKADLDDYQTAQSLFEQLERLIKESYAYQGV
ncbi:hypothetical protein [Neobacillus drentensis]|uniref:hypothetical protein n=1 Tax=Neobacillus drentensis TaxID=220684 RepID=UPI003001D1D5